MSDMGTFRTTIAIENPLNRGPRHVFVDALVDTGAELTWVPAAMLVSLGIARQKRVGFRTADGRAVYRDVGYAIVHAGGTETNDEVVFGEAGDTTLLGARSLEGLNLRVDAREKRLVEAGPMPAMATIAQHTFGRSPRIIERHEGRRRRETTPECQVAVRRMMRKARFAI